MSLICLALVGVVFWGKNNLEAKRANDLKNEMFSSQEVFNEHMDSLYNNLDEYNDKMASLNQDDFSDKEWKKMSDKGMGMSKQIDELEEEAFTKGLKPYYIYKEEETNNEILNSPNKMVEHIEKHEELTESMLLENHTEEEKQGYKDRLEQYRELKEKINNELKSEANDNAEEIKKEFKELFKIK